MEQLILNCILLIIDGTFLFWSLNKLIRIPGNKKILRRVKNVEKHSKLTSSFFLLVILIVLVNILFLKII